MATIWTSEPGRSIHCMWSRPRPLTPTQATFSFSFGLRGVFVSTAARVGRGIAAKDAAAAAKIDCSMNSRRVCLAIFCDTPS